MNRTRSLWNENFINISKAPIIHMIRRRLIFYSLNKANIVLWWKWNLCPSKYLFFCFLQIKFFFLCLLEKKSAEIRQDFDIDISFNVLVLSLEQKYCHDKVMYCYLHIFESIASVVLIWIGPILGMLFFIEVYAFFNYFV